MVRTTSISQIVGSILPLPMMGVRRRPGFESWYRHYSITFFFWPFVVNEADPLVNAAVTNAPKEKIRERGEWLFPGSGWSSLRSRI